MKKKNHAQALKIKKNRKQQEDGKDFISSPFCLVESEKVEG